MLQILLLSLFFTPKLALATTTSVTPYNASETTISTPLDTYLDRLEICESGGNPKALNPKDLDGTPSKGAFQFKDTTFTYFSRKYGIKTTSIWNREEQRSLVKRMATDPQVNMKRQFPDCVRKLGLPPLVD